MTCSELIAVLRRYPADMAVFVECEGCWKSILDNAVVDKIKHCHPDDVADILVFDTDFNR